MTKRMSRILAILFVVFSLTAGNAQAEFFGLPNGRSASPDMLSDLSVELGFVSGDLGPVDYQNFGARVNYRVSPEVVIIGDIGASEFGRTDGTPVGLGILYHLAKQRISQKVDIAAKASYHMGEYKRNSVKIDLTGLTFEVLFSGRQPLSDNGLGWYSNFGFHRVSVKNDSTQSDNEVGIGGGLTLPTGSGEAYIGVDLIDELIFGLGFRYFVQ